MRRQKGGSVICMRQIYALSPTTGVAGAGGNRNLGGRGGRFGRIRFRGDGRGAQGELRAEGRGSSHAVSDT